MYKWLCAILWLCASISRGGELTGVWINAGDNGQICSLIQNGLQVTLVDQEGHIGRGHFITGDTFILSDYRISGLRGRVTNAGTRIEWPGNFWQRGHPSLTGLWLNNGKDNQVCAFFENGTQVMIVDEAGQIGRGRFVSGNTFTLTDYRIRDLQGRVADDGLQIEWPGNSWTRVIRK